MRAALVADIHLTERKGESYATLEEQIDLLRWIGNDAVEHGAQILLVGGDTFDSKSTVAERNAAIRVYQSWAECFPVVAVKGNNTHDAPGDIAFIGKLRGKHSIHVFEEPGQYVTNAGDVIACLPYPEKALLASRLEPGQGVGQMAAEAMRIILMGLSLEFNKHSGARILLGHLEVGSSITDSGQPLCGKAAVEISEGDLLDTGADLIALGHIHKHQVLQDRIVYAGGVRQCTFGEDTQKGYCLIDVERGKPPVITHRQAPGRQLVTFEGQWIQDDLTPDGANIQPVRLFDWGIGTARLEDSVPTGAAVRLKYEINESERHAAAEQVERDRRVLLAAGAHSVKIDARTIATHRVRSEEIRVARTTVEKLEALWASRGHRPDSADRLLEKLGTLEAEVSP